MRGFAATHSVGLALALAVTAAPAPGADAAARRAGAVEVDIEGLERELRQNVEATLSLAAAAEEDELTDGDVRSLHARALGEIERALEPYGYYRPTVRPSLERAADGWRARYEVDPGPPLLLERVEVAVTGPGASEAGFRERVRDFPLQRGERLRHAPYESGKSAFVDVAHQNGYLDAKFAVSEIRVDLDAYAAAIDLRLETGPRYLFGETRFHQEPRAELDPDLLAGYVRYEPGEPIDMEKLLRMQAALAESPYFARVEVLPRTEEAEALRVPIDVELLPAARQKWDLGVGYGTDTGPRAKVSLEVRRINRRGHRLESSVTASGIEQSFAARYLIPGAYPRTDSWTATVGYADLSPDTSSSETYLAGLARTRSIGDWRQALGLTYQRADFVVASDRGESELVVPEAGWSRVRADDRIYPRQGDRIELAVRGAAESVGSDTSFGQATIRAKAIRKLGAQARAIARLELGHTWTDDFHALPPSMRFFAGGDQSVRGFAYQALGPRDAAGDVLGGESLLVAGLEIDALFFEPGKLGRWGAAIFADHGAASNELGKGLETGVGVGLRWLSPIGLVRADAAWAIDQPGTPVRFHLMIGPDL